MDINYSRYCDATSAPFQRVEKLTFLHKWQQSWFNKWHNHFREEYKLYYEYSSAYYETECEKGRLGISVVQDAEYRYIENKWNPVKRHKILWWIAKIPMNIQTWLCCGWKLHYDQVRHIWTYVDSYHMMSKLCRCGSPMWPEYKFTWWDKLRFKWITGYKYDENRKEV